MNLTMTVRMAAVSLLVCAGFFHFIFASNRLRILRLPGPYKEWNVALNACNETYESSVTVYDDEDATFINNFLKTAKPEGSAWLGLRKRRNVTWSDGSPLNFTYSSVNITDIEQMCEAIDNKTWTGFNCSDSKYFMCYRNQAYSLFRQNKTWCQALQYCRKHFGDLVSIKNKTENEEVIKEGNNTSFWIGLLHDKWQWEDGGCSSFRKGLTTGGEAPGEPQECTVSSSTPLSKYDCSLEAHSFCSKGNMRIRVIQETRTWEDAFNYCKAKHSGPLWIGDKEDQDAVQQSLQYARNDSNDSLFWIGLRQSHVFGFWIWIDRTVSYSNWKNDIQPQVSRSNHCGAINGTDYTWIKANCSLSLPFLCEEEIVFMDELRNP